MFLSEEINSLKYSSAKIPVSNFLSFVILARLRILEKFLTLFSDLKLCSYAPLQQSSLKNKNRFLKTISRDSFDSIDL